MKIVDAVWEKRNLGVSCKEIMISSEDTIEEVKRVLNSIDCEYSVVKCPSCRLDVYKLLSENGFFYAETSFHMIHDLKTIPLSPIQKRMDEAVDYCPMGENDFVELKNYLFTNMFDTDRVFLDAEFSDYQAANRYFGWIEDEKSRETEFFKYIYKNECVGFFAFKEIDEGVYYPFLAGIYPNKNNVGVGSVYLHKPLYEAKKRNAKIVSTYISSNNLKAIKAHSFVGFVFDDVQYVFVKHLQGGKDNEI